MQRLTKFKQIILLLIMALPTVWCSASIIHSTDGNSAIQIKESNVQHTPKGSSIQASIDGHTLTVAFSENLGQVVVEVTTAIIGNTDKVTFRVSDSFEITGSFQANSGCEFTAIRQDCPD